MTPGVSTASGIVRWLSPDPIGISGGLNQYVFCGNNPVCFVDPFGLVDMNLTRPGSEAYNNFEKMKTVDGSFSVGAHRDFFWNGVAGLSSLELARKILADKRYKPGQTVTLATCDGGKTLPNGSSYARDLADWLTRISGRYTDVVSPTTKLWVSEDGRTILNTEPPVRDSKGNIHVTGTPGIWSRETGSLMGRQ